LSVDKAHYRIKVFWVLKLENVLGHPVVSFFSIIDENDDTAQRGFLLRHPVRMSLSTWKFRLKTRLFFTAFC